MSLWRHAYCLRGGGRQRGPTPSCRCLASSGHGRRRSQPCIQPRFSSPACRATSAYWAEALGGPRTYSESYGDETTVVRMHSGNGEHDEMNRRAIACFDQALVDVGLADDNALRQVLRDYFACATTTTMSRYHQSLMMCLAASASHAGHGTDSSCKSSALACTIPAVHFEHIRRLDIGLCGGPILPSQGASPCEQHSV